LKKEDRRCTKNYNSKLLEAVCEHKQQQLRFITAGKRKQKKRGFKGTGHIFYVHFFTHLSHVSSVRGKGGQEGVG
jgi:hypothetical protein